MAKYETIRKLFLSLCAVIFLSLNATQGQANLEGDPFAETELFIEGDPFGEGISTKITQENTQKPLHKEQNILLGGYLESRNQANISYFSQPLSLRQSIYAEALWDISSLSFFGSAKAEYEAASFTWEGDHNPNRFFLNELYASYDSEYVDIFLGRKIHRWGTGDGINPMDLINPLDTTDPIATGRTDNRLPVWLASTTFSLQNMSLELVFLPFAAVQELPDYGNPWVPYSLNLLQEQAHVGFITEDCSNPESGSVEFGGRLSWQALGWDMSLMFFHGKADTPIYTQEMSIYPKMQGEYYDFSAYGISFAKGFGSQTVRGEFSYKPSYPVQGIQGLEEANLWQGVLGWDWDIDGKYYINMQAFADIQNKEDASGSDNWHGFAYEMSALWLYDALKTGVRGKVYTSGDGTLTEFFTEYTFNDHWKYYAGFLLWTGNSTKLLGQYDKNDSVYITVRYSF